MFDNDSEVVNGYFVIYAPVSDYRIGVDSQKEVNMFEWILTFLSIMGTLLNIQKKLSCWVVWSVANVGWIVSFSLKDMMAEATLFVVYLILSTYGYLKWRRLQKMKPSH